MDLLSFILGAVFAGVISFFFFRRNNYIYNKNLQRLKKTIDEDHKKASFKIEDLERDLELKINRLKILAEENDVVNDRNDTLRQEIYKIKKVNNSLKDENDKHVSTIREYEMLFNAKKDEISKLKSQLKK